MKESELYPAVWEWLQAQKCPAVHVEVFDADVIGLFGEKAVVIELKTNCSSGLVRQLEARAQWADEVWGVVPTTPDRDKVRLFRRQGRASCDGLARVPSAAEATRWRRAVIFEIVAWNGGAGRRRRVGVPWSAS